MNFLTKLGDFIGGSLFKEIKETAMAYFPPDATPQQKAEFEIQLERLAANKLVEANKMLSEAETNLNKRIAEQEGTASDLKGIPLLGTAVLFLRGVQRPLWGFSTLFMDYKWLFERHTFSEQQHTAMIVINVLVLGFLFGERTIKNLEPLIIKVFGAKGNG